ncbi:MAG: GYF domain-containing protein [Verrucomicrobiota bacterium]|nr:GYF domain-containing protein [Verrucomicrobiota bacterium]
MNILVNRDGNHLGPYTYDQVSQLLAEGKLQAWDIAWPDGGREWVTLDQIDGLTERAFALRDQRLSEENGRSSAAHSIPNAKFISSSRSIQSPKRDWSRVWVWTLMVLILAGSLFIWRQKLNKTILIDNLNQRDDSLTYMEGANQPFSGTANEYFNDGSLRKKSQFEDGLRHGEQTHWHINGSIALKESYHSGVLKKATSYDFSGTPSGQYQNGAGILILYWPESGIRSQKQVYKTWKIVERTIWDQNGRILSSPSPRLAPPETTQTTNQTVSITNSLSITAPTNQSPVPGLLPARGKLWLIDRTDNSNTPREIDKRIDLIYANKYYTNIVNEFGNPDEILENKIYVYRNMRVRHASKDTEYNQVLFHFVNGYVNLIEALP